MADEADGFAERMGQPMRLWIGDELIEDEPEDEPKAGKTGDARRVAAVIDERRGRRAVR